MKNFLFVCGDHNLVNIWTEQLGDTANDTFVAPNGYQAQETLLAFEQEGMEAPYCLLWDSNSYYEDLLKYLSGSDYCKDIMVVLVMGKEADFVVPQKYTPRITDVILKPFTGPKFQNLISKLLEAG